MKKSMQFTKLPNKMGFKGLKPKDLLIYICLRSYMNKDTKEAFPSMETISKQLSISTKTVSTSIKRLVEKDFITVRKEGRKNVYKFKEIENFEPFSKEFLDNKDISFEVKAFLASTLQYMFTGNEGYGIISMSDKDLSKKIGIGERSINRYNSELRRNDLMVDPLNVKRDIENGCHTKTKIYKLALIGQSIIWKLREHDKRLNEHDDKLNEYDKRFNELEKKIAEKDKLIEKLMEKNNNQEKTKYIMQ